MRVAFLIGSLQTGGAERMHALLARSLLRAGHDPLFWTIDAAGATRRNIEILEGIRREAILLRKRPGLLRLPQLIGAWRPLRRMIDRAEPDVVYAALDWANWLAMRASRSTRRRVPVVIGMPGGDGPIGWKRRIAEHLLARESPPAAIAAYSHDGLDALHRRGIRSPIEQVVPPGVDCGRFRFLPEQAVAIRRELGVPPDTALIGHVGRLHPVKDHPLLLRGFGMISGQPHLVCVGDGDAGYAEKLRALAAAIGVAARVHWWPHREDMAAVYSAIDALAVPSYSEGGPLVVAEAMACGTPCVVTRVGTASEFVGTLGGILTERTPQALASAIQTLLESVPSGQACRSRIQSHFSLERMSQATLELFERVV